MKKMKEETMSQKMRRLTAEANAGNRVRAEKDKGYVKSIVKDLSNLQMADEEPVVKAPVKKKKPLTLREKMKKRNDDTAKAAGM